MDPHGAGCNEKSACHVCVFDHIYAANVVDQGHINARIGELSIGHSLQKFSAGAIDTLHLAGGNTQGCAPMTFAFLHLDKDHTIPILNDQINLTR